jgi:hypothetical protein
MDPVGDDLDSAFYVVQRFIDGLRAGAPPVPKQVTDWCLKIRLTWETSDCGHENDSGAGEFHQELCDTAEAARIIGITERQVRRHANDLDGFKRGGVWLFPRRQVIDYAEE